MGLYESWREGWSPHRVAITTETETLNFGELDDLVRRTTGWLQGRGIGRGDVVGVAMPKDPGFVALVLACLRLGAVALPLNDRATARELAWPLTHAKARLAILPVGISLPDGPPVVPADQVRGAIGASTPADPTDPVPDEASAILLYTSGTTGRPKGAPASQRNLRAAVEALHGAWEWRADDVLLHTLPQFHVHGLVVATFGALRAGATAIWRDRFDPEEVLDALESGPATIFMGVPTFWARMLEQAGRRDLRRMRLVTSGSAGLPADHHRAIAERFGVEVVERYGMTEIGIVVGNPLGGERRPGSIGLPLPGVEARVVREADRADAGPDEVGELWIRGPSVFAGYLDDPEASAAVLVDGWMRTGDLGRRSADGYLTLVGRRSDLILVGGFNVYPAEVEAALLRCPGVREAAVVGIPDPDLGEVPFAAVVGDADPEDLRRRLRLDLSAYKIPRRIVLVDPLPRNAMGKVAKRVLADAWVAPLVHEITVARGAVERARTAALHLAEHPEDGDAGVRALAQTLPSADATLHELRHHQHDALAEPRYEALRREVDALRARWTETNHVVYRARRASAALEPLIAQVGVVLGSLGTEGSADPVGVEQALRNAVTTVTDELGLDLDDGPLPDQLRAHRARTLTLLDRQENELRLVGARLLELLG